MNSFLSMAIREVIARQRLMLFGALVLSAVVAVITSEPEELAFLRESEPLTPYAALDARLGSPLAGILGLWLSVLAVTAVVSAAYASSSMWNRGDAAFYLPKPVSRGSLFWSRLVATGSVYGGLLAASGVVVSAMFALAHHGYGATIWWLPAGQIVIFVCGYLFVVWLVFLAGSFRRGLTAAVLLSLSHIALSRFLHADSLPVDGGLRAVAQFISLLLPGFSSAAGALVSLASGHGVTTWAPVISTLVAAGAAFWWARHLYLRREF